MDEGTGAVYHSLNRSTSEAELLDSHDDQKKAISNDAIAYSDDRSGVRTIGQ
jgi:hypothetical protein